MTHQNKECQDMRDDISFYRDQIVRLQNSLEWAGKKIYKLECENIEQRKRLQASMYRGKSIDEELKTGEWIYGSLVFDEMGNPFIVGPVVEACEEYINFEYWVPVDPATVGQHTGMKDTDGLSIYEGDIVMFSYWWFDGNGQAESPLTGAIVYIPECMSFGLEGVKNPLWIKHVGGKEGEVDTQPFAIWNFEEADFAVMGNVYDTPELMESC